MRVGILALQGDFAAHHEKLTELGATPLLVRHLWELEAVSALILPGGESTTMLKLLDQSLRDGLVARIRAEMPVFATCAGCILLAKSVTNPEQESLQVIDIDVSRNAYGRQLDSFVDPELQWTTAGTESAKRLKIKALSVEGVFIRAPRITRVGQGVTTLLQRQDEPVLVQQGNILSGTFHPELSPGPSVVHQMLLNLAG